MGWQEREEVVEASVAVGIRSETVDSERAAEGEAVWADCGLLIACDPPVTPAPADLHRPDDAAGVGSTTGEGSTQRQQDSDDEEKRRKRKCRPRSWMSTRRGGQGAGVDGKAETP